MMAIAAVAAQVHTCISGDPSDSITGNANSAPVVRERQGLAMVEPARSCGVNASASWTGSVNRVSNLWCRCCPEVGNHTDGVSHACNSPGRMHRTSWQPGWTAGGGVTLKLYLR